MSVYILLVGVIAAILKVAEIDPLTKLSWWWIAIPFVITMIIWEVLTPILGLDKKKEQEQAALDKKKRQARLRGN